ncbi:hypothetical protein HZB88_01985 [archaeon]|nr:hypothetical protein [archaeon]
MNKNILILIVLCVIVLLFITSCDIGTTGKAVAQKNATLSIKTYSESGEIPAYLTITHTYIGEINGTRKIQSIMRTSITDIVWEGSSPVNLSLGAAKYGIKAEYGKNYSAYNNRNITLVAGNTTFLNITLKLKPEYMWED